jgi:hypothetical protein
MDITILSGATLRLTGQTNSIIQIQGRLNIMGAFYPSGSCEIIMNTNTLPHSINAPIIMDPFMNKDFYYFQNADLIGTGSILLSGTDRLLTIDSYSTIGIPITSTSKGKITINGSPVFNNNITLMNCCVYPFIVNGTNVTFNNDVLLTGMSIFSGSVIGNGAITIKSLASNSLATFSDSGSSTSISIPIYTQGFTGKI